MKVFFNGFWPDFFNEGKDGNTYIFFIDLLEKVFQCKITQGNIENSEILCETVFGIQTITKKQWLYSFFFSGESYLGQMMDKYDVVLYGKKTTGNIVNCPLFVSYIHCMKIDLENITNRKNIPKNNVLCIISNPRGEFRNKFLDYIETKMTITYAGNYRKNFYENVPSGWWTKNYIDFISNWKVIICFENSSVETYISEKIINPLIAGCVPVYWGAEFINDYINPERFIKVEKVEDFEKTLEKIQNIITSDELFLEMVNKKIIRNKIDIDNISNDIQKTLNLR